MTTCVRITKATRDLNAIRNNIETLNFSELLLLTRKALAVTRKIIAKEMGVHSLTLHNLELGKHSRIPSVDVLTKIADYYGYDVNILLEKAKNHEIEKLAALEKSREKLQKVTELYDYKNNYSRRSSVKIATSL